MSPQHRTWTRDGFLISTDPTLIPLTDLNTAFNSSALYWAQPLPLDVMRKMVDSSLCFGVYSPTSSLPPESNPTEEGEGMGASDVMHEIATHVQPHPAPRPTLPNRQESSTAAPELIGFARLITDQVTFSYLTDVYILPAWQGSGLGKWLIQCVQETLDGMPWLRKSMAIIGGADAPQAKGLGGFYEKLMGLGDMQKGRVIVANGRGSTF